MKYRVTHTTEYAYGEPVPLCHNLLRLRPRDMENQTCHHNEVKITPPPAARRDRIDFFGNHTAWMSIQEPHQRLSITAVSEIDVTPVTMAAAQNNGDAIFGPTWEDAVHRLSSPRDPAAFAARQYTFESPHCPINSELAVYAGASFFLGRPLFQCVLDLNRRIHEEFTFDPSATNIQTPVQEVFRHRHGVCQDFAHLAISILRSLGLAARYVSGYVVTKPAPGQPRRVGGDASHAWFSCFIPDIGWVDYDPTHGSLPSDNHVTIGWARDYDDIAPVKGIITGSRRHLLHVSVDVAPVIPDPPAGQTQSQTQS